MPPFVAGLVAVCAVAASCSTSRRQEAADSSAVVRAPPALSYERPPGLFADARSPSDSARITYWSFAEALPKTRSGFLAKFGPATRITSDTSRNAYDSTVTDTVVRLVYPYIEVLFFVGEGGNEFPIHVVVTDSTVKLPLPVGVGASESDLVRFFGVIPSDAARGDTVSVGFAVPGAVDNNIAFQLVHGRVRRVDWDFYVD